MNIKEIMEDVNAGTESEVKEYIKRPLLLEEEIHQRRRAMIMAKAQLIEEINRHIVSADYGTISVYNELFAHMDRVIGYEGNLYGAHKELDRNGNMGFAY